MAFVDYEFYKNLYGTSAVASSDFGRIAWMAEKAACDATTGVDGICKLTEAFPENERDAEAVKRCICALVDLMAQVEKANADAAGGKVVASMHAGNESVTYAVNGGTVGAVLSSKASQDLLYRQTVDSYLRGTKDKNGVNMLFKGVYPFVI